MIPQQAYPMTHGQPVYSQPAFAQPSTLPSRAPQPAQWQVPTNAPAPTKVRGVSAEPTTQAKFVLPSPQSLGIATTLNTPAAPTQTVDWNQIQSRIERLGVVRYEKARVGEMTRVRLILPTGDPNVGQPVTAEAATEAAAILAALDHAEAWVRKR